MTPTPGRIVQYTLTADDAESVNRRRKDAEANGFGRMAKTGDQVHIGNAVKEGDTFPLIITRVWGTTETSSINGQVLLDGNDTLWVCSVNQGEGARHWREFPRV